MTYNLASAWETVSETIPDEQAVVSGETQRTWRGFEDRAARLASALGSAGLGPGDNVGLCLYNGNEYLEAQFAVMKQRCAPFNVNYRYVAAELASLLKGADARAVFFAAELSEQFEQVQEQLGGGVVFVQVGAQDNIADWAVGYEALIAANEPAPRIERDPEDLWLLFTGGTTGQPKGVMWPHGQMAGVIARNYVGMGMEPPRALADIGERVRDIRAAGLVTRQLAAAPLMHGTSGLVALATLTQGGAVLTMAEHSFDPDSLWRCAGRERATHITIVGDAFCRPMVSALDRAVEREEPYDLSSVFLIASSGVMWSAPVKADLLRHNPAMRLLDALGSSEGVGFASKLEGDAATTSTAKFELGANARVLAEDGSDIVPGSGQRGRLAVAGPLPSGYYKDPVKSAETWPVIDGVRYSIPGDWATVEADGSIVLLGRGSVCINTGGEKVYPEEVEEALKLLDDVVDANVVGVPDERWGQAITAVVELAEGCALDPEALKAAMLQHLAAYKAPKHWVEVPELVRAANGKSDYRWALATAKAALANVE